MLELDNNNRGIGHLDFFEDFEFVRVFELDNITLGIGKPDFSDNIAFVFELDYIIGRIGELDFFYFTRCV